MLNPGFIVVEGPIGVGKTSLARRLAETFGSELLLEGAADNPFLERFYRNPRSAAMQTQLFFLLQRAQQMQELRQADMFEPVRVADFLMDKDRLFARLTLDNEEYKLYEQVYSHLTIDVPKPDLVIYLQAPVDVLMKRIGKRGIAYERAMESRIPQVAVRNLHAVFPLLRRGAVADRERRGHQPGGKRRRLPGTAGTDGAGQARAPLFQSPAQSPARSELR